MLEGVASSQFREDSALDPGGCGPQVGRERQSPPPARWLLRSRSPFRRRTKGLGFRALGPGHAVEGLRSAPTRLPTQGPRPDLEAVGSFWGSATRGAWPEGPGGCVPPGTEPSTPSSLPHRRAAVGRSGWKELNTLLPPPQAAPHGAPHRAAAGRLSSVGPEWG